MSSNLPVLRLRGLRNSTHPWIFGKMVRTPERRVPPGSLVEVRDRDNTFVGRGIYNAAKTIALRLLTEYPAESIDEDFFRRKLTQAKALREDVLRIGEQSDSYRLVHSESDGLSGLIVDKFADVIVVEPFSAGYVNLGPVIIKVLRELYPKAWVCFRPDPRTEDIEGVSFAKLAHELPAPDGVEIRENQLRMWVDFKSGHKTGFFLDQRENRAMVARLARDREVLDLCCYTGGFAISALLGGAKKAIGVDLDEKALVTAEKNAKRNDVAARAEWAHANVFDYLRRMGTEGRKADLVILDPSKLAGVKAEISRGMRTYGDLNKLAIEAVRPGGILVTCSCSGLISPDTFLSIVRNSAGEAGAVLKVLEFAGAGPDHPVASNFPESRYLKVIFAQVVPGLKVARRPEMEELGGRGDAATRGRGDGGTGPARRSLGEGGGRGDAGTRGPTSGSASASVSERQRQADGPKAEG